MCARASSTQRRSALKSRVDFALVGEARDLADGLSPADLVVMISVRGYKTQAHAYQAAEMQTRSAYNVFDGISGEAYQAAKRVLNNQRLFLRDNVLTLLGERIVEGYRPDLLSSDDKLRTFRGCFAVLNPKTTEESIS